MKTLEQIKNEVAVNREYSNWDHAYMSMNFKQHNSFIDEVATEYAAQCCDEQIKECASNVQCYEHATTYQDISETPNVVTTK